MQDRRATRDEWWRLAPQGTSTDAIRILAARGVRAFGDGFVALLLPIYLLDLGFSAFAIGAIVCGTLVGTAVLTLWLGIVANRHSLRRLLLAASLLMAATGVGFAVTTAFWPLLVIAIVGTMNPTSGDASVFLPLEQTALTQTVEPRRRTALFARYSVIGSVAGALGVLAAAAPDLATNWTGCTRAAVTQLMFGFYGALGILALLLYRPLRRQSKGALRFPRRRCISRAASSIGWLPCLAWIRSAPAFWFSPCSRCGSITFAISVTTAASILFWSSICSAISYLAAVPIAARIGLINTMVFTHLPSNILLILVPFAPNLAIVIGVLLARSALSQMDVPTRSSYVMAVVTPEERPAAASIIAVPKRFAWAAGSMISGSLLTLSGFGWPLLIAGVVKATYDILLLIKFQKCAPRRRSVPLRVDRAHTRPSRWYNHPVIAPSSGQQTPAAANEATTFSATIPEGTLLCSRYSGDESPGSW